MTPLVPAVDKEALDSTTPALDLGRHRSSPFAHIDSQHVPKQLLWLAPLVASKLPDLTGCEDGDDAVPIVGLEMLGGVDDDEPEGSFFSAGVQGREESCGVEKVGCRLAAEFWMVRWHKEALIEERLDVAQAEEGGG